MLHRAAFSAFALMTLAACGSSAPAADTTHGVSTDPVAATGFITVNTPAPDTASDSRDDGVLRDADGRPYHYAFLGEALPDVVAPLHAGGTFDSAAIDAWTIIDVWGVWCGDCRKDSPYASELSERLKSDPEINFISIHTPSSAVRADDAFGKFGSLDAYFDEVGYAYPVAMDADASIRNVLQIAWTPTYLLVSPDGVVRGFRTDLSVAGDAPVDAFLADIQTVIDDISS